MKTTPAAWAVKSAAFGVVGGGGNDEVDVGVVLDLPTPGVEDTGEAESGSAGLGGADVLVFLPRTGWLDAISAIF